MAQMVYFGLCLLGCFILGVTGTTEEDVGDDEATAKSSCPPGAIYVRGNCYEFFPIAKSWDAAEAECQSLRRGSHLASFSSMREEKTVSAFIKAHSSTYYAWIGLNAMPHGDDLVWEWSDGSPYVSGAPLWDNRSPSASASSPECVVLNNIQYPSASNRWLQANCEYTFSYVCKYRACD